MHLPKVALEEAFVLPDMARAMGDSSHSPDPKVTGLSGEVRRAIAHKLSDFDGLRREEMERSGIEHAILSLGNFGPQRIADRGEAAELARVSNDFLAEQVARHPHHYSGFAALALQDPDGAVSELERTKFELGFKGALINGYSTMDENGFVSYLDEPMFDAFWEAVEELGVPIYLHPRLPHPDSYRIYEGHPELVGHIWGFTTETSTHILRLIFSGLFDRYPRVQLIVGHLGEAIPACLGRIQAGFDLTPFDKNLEKRVEEYFADNIWLTTSGNFYDQALIGALLTVGSDRIMFAVDYPYNEMSIGAHWLDTAPISIVDRRKIAYANAVRLFDIATPALESLV